MPTLYHTGTKAAEQQSQHKKLFSDIAISAFRCDRRGNLKISMLRAHATRTMITYTKSDTSREYLILHPEPVSPPLPRVQGALTPPPPPLLVQFSNGPGDAGSNRHTHEGQPVCAPRYD